MIKRTLTQSIRIQSLTIILISIHLTSFGQHIYSSRIGSKFLPGHSDLTISVSKDHLIYELFNHWYSGSFAELRQISISLDSLDNYNKSNDSININILSNKIHLIDNRYGIDKKIKHRKLCTSIENMRKISYAFKISTQYYNLNHYDLYDKDDLILDEKSFQSKVLENLQKMNKTRR